MGGIVLLLLSLQMRLDYDSPDGRRLGATGHRIKVADIWPSEVFEKPEDDPCASPSPPIMPPSN